MLQTFLKPKLFILAVWLSSVFVNDACSQPTSDSAFHVYFETNSYTIKKEAAEKLNTFLHTFPEVIAVEGFADTTGSTAHNLLLSQKRAEAVAQALMEHGVLKKFRIKASGETNKHQALWQARRVTITATFSKPHATGSFGFSGDTTNAEQRNTEPVEKITAEHLLFLPDLPVITDDSKPYVDALALRLKALPQARFEIIGHVNYQSHLGAEHLQDLYRLSEARAKAVYEMLAAQGIPKEKMRYKGVGNSQLVYADPQTLEEKLKNMRVEVLIYQE